MTIRDELLAGQDAASVMRQDGLPGDLKKALPNWLIVAESNDHLSQDRAAGEDKNRHSVSGRKRVLTDDSNVDVRIPLKRAARFDPVVIGKYRRRLPGFGDKVISLLHASA